MKIENAYVEQKKVDIPHIVLNDEHACFAGSKIISKVSIRSKGIIKEYIIERTKAGGYLMK